MSVEHCKDCVFSTPPSKNATCMTCDYPVPAWIRLRVSGGEYVNGYEAKRCPVSKSRADIVADVKRKLP